MRGTRAIRAAILAGLVATAGCGNNSSTNNPDPVVPVAVTETFSGSINRNGAVTHSFSVNTIGLVSATLSTLTSGSATNVGVSLGAWNGLTCQLIITNDKAPAATTVTGTASTVGQFCVRVYDVGEITDAAPAAYELVVTHY